MFRQVTRSNFKIRNSKQVLIIKSPFQILKIRNSKFEVGALISYNINYVYHEYCEYP
jgi:hypothetical protein